MRIAVVASLCPLVFGCAIENTFTTTPAEPSSDAIVRVELDVVGDSEIGLAALEVARRSFGAVGIDARFHVSRDPALAVPERLVERGDKEHLLETTRSLADHVHVVIAPRGAGAHGVTHYPRDGSSALESAGVFVFVDSIADDYRANELLADVGLEIDQLVGRTLTHELGHALGCPHGGEAEDGTVMVQNSTLGPVTGDTIARWKRALDGEGLGFPSFAPDDRACLDLSAKLSVDRAQPAYLD